MKCSVIDCDKVWMIGIGEDRLCFECWLRLQAGERLDLPDGSLKIERIKVRKKEEVSDESTPHISR